MVVYLEGIPTQFIDATPEQCTGVAYQSFTELELKRRRVSDASSERRLAAGP